MVSILGISGSLRRSSFNSGLLRAAAEVSPEGTEFIVAGIAGVPLYDADVETADGIPEPVRILKEQLASSDRLLLVTPEYNNGIPGVFKNAIDWMSRPASEIPYHFGGKPVAVIGASPGGFGTILSQNHWLPVLRTLGTQPWFEGRLMVSRAGSVFDEAGNLTDTTVRGRLREFMAGFSQFVAKSERVGKEKP